MAFGFSRPAVQRPGQVQPPTVTSILRFGGQMQRDARLRDLASRPVQACPFTGRARWRTAAGVVLRASAAGSDLEVLANCAC